ncbi:MAG: DNA-processing protein DprA [Proteobacteria bacterium]|nr:DNA-processing protein DprA [Pseudomonadota bacterium]
MAVELSFTDKRDWLRLIGSERIGPITFHRLLERYGDVSSALAALPDLVRSGGGRQQPRIMPIEEAEQRLEAYDSIGASLIGFGEEDYPPLLMQVEDAPPLIGVLGDRSLLRRPMVAIVGTRNGSINGTRFARRLAGELGECGFTVISGLARGIDAAAHQGALETGTVAVVAGGVDVIYPKENTALYEEIVRTGVIISEMPPGMVPQARHFPRRNRLISGCAPGVVVVEAAKRSGSLITARMALEQNRDVFAVPGSPLDPRAGGTNHLLRQGAILTESVEDILEVLGGPETPRVEPPQLIINKEQNSEPSDLGDLQNARAEIIKILGPTPVTVDELIRECHMSPAVVSTVLLELELSARLERHPGNQISLIGCE